MHFLVLRSYSQDFLDSGLATQRFYEAVDLHRYHAFFDGLGLDLFAGAVGDDKLLDFR
jgi:hypothetical protein